MLALSASDLASSSVQTGDRLQLTSTALAHRVQAISALSNAITSGIDCFEQGNAILATCFVLLFQSTLVDDGLVEYITFIRGTIAVGIQMGSKRMKFLFQNLFDDESLKQLDSAISASPLIRSEVVESACRSFEQLQHLCQSKIEIEVYTILFGIAHSLISSPRDGEISRLLCFTSSSAFSDTAYSIYEPPRNV
jgi:hypothetical protein